MNRFVEFLYNLVLIPIKLLRLIPTILGIIKDSAATLLFIVCLTMLWQYAPVRKQIEPVVVFAKPAILKAEKVAKFAGLKKDKSLYHHAKTITVYILIKCKDMIIFIIEKGLDKFLVPVVFGLIILKVVRDNMPDLNFFNMKL